MFYGFGKPYGFIGSPFFKKPFFKPFFGKGFPATKASGFSSAVPNTTIATTPFPGI